MYEIHDDRVEANSHRTTTVTNSAALVGATSVRVVSQFAESGVFWGSGHVGR
jgi:hypothetical protein